MKKTNVLWLIPNSIFLIIFNVLFFVIGGVEHNMSVWISYGFIHFAYFMLLITQKLGSRGKSAAIFLRTLQGISETYFLLTFIVGVVFILIAPEGFRAALVVQLVIAGLYAIRLVINMIANERTAEVEEKQQYEISYVKDASARLKGLVDTIGDKEVKRKVERLFDAVYSSPVKSHADLVQMESCILDSIAELEDAVRAGNKEEITARANSLLGEVNERNMRLRRLN